MFGKTVILLLIQLGGLGVMTFSVFLFLFLGKGLGTKQRWIVNETFSASPIREIKSLIRSIFIFTFSAEAIGALSLFMFWHRTMSFQEAFGKSVFHSVSAFCNAGFSTISTSFIDYRGDIWLNATIILLIVMGGLGFPVIYEFRNRIIQARRHKRVSMSLHSKMVLSTTAVLILAGWALIYLFEMRGSLAGTPLKDRILVSLFQSVTARTAGFNTIDMSALCPATLFILIMLMFVGASPGSCGGGIKTTSIAVFIAIVREKLAGGKTVSIFGRTIPEDTVSRALAIFVLAIVVVTAGLVFLLVTQLATPQSGDEYFLSYLFEAVSAFGTVGLSMGLTPSLTTAGKLVLIVLMLLGRVGLLTVAYVVTRRVTVRLYKYAEEKVMIG
jgi:trk system potassium uptake protein TrkH